MKLNKGLGDIDWLDAISNVAGKYFDYKTANAASKAQIAASNYYPISASPTPIYPVQPQISTGSNLTTYIMLAGIGVAAIYLLGGKK